jgi:deoxyhypusine synthase
MVHVVVLLLRKQVLGEKVNISKEQMVFAEATSVLPLIASDAYHKGDWKNRTRKNFSKIFK